MRKLSRRRASPKSRPPALNLDGELQLDAALVPSVGASKGAGVPLQAMPMFWCSRIWMQATSGISWYSALPKQRHWDPLCRGLAKPVNDLSRGCSADDVVKVIAITVVQAQAIQ